MREGRREREGRKGKEREGGKGKRERERVNITCISIMSSFILESQYYTYLRKSPPWRRGIVFVVIQYEIIFFSCIIIIVF